MSTHLLHHYGRLAVLVLVGLTCLGCFCVDPDTFSTKESVHIETVPDGLWIGHDDSKNEPHVLVGWNDSLRAYKYVVIEEEKTKTSLVRFYPLGSIPYYYAVLVIDTDASAQDECSAQIFLARIKKKGLVELVYPSDLDDARDKALMNSHGVEYINGKYVGSADAIKAYLFDLPTLGPLDVVVRFEYTGQ